MTKRIGSSNVGMIVFVAVIAVVVGLFWWQPWKTPPDNGGNDKGLPVNNGKNNNEEPEPPSRAAALDLQRQGKWCEAKEKWEAARTEAKAGSLWSAEAENNLMIVAELCEPKKPLVEELKIPPPPPEKRPQEVSEEDILAYYPKGRKIQSIAYFTIQGKGENQQWIFKGESNFTYLYRVLVETEVVDNRRTAVVFDQRFKEVEQLRAVSSQSLELNFPDSPILATVWPQVEEQFLNPIPAYHLVKKVAAIANLADPRARKSLTWLQNRLRRLGVKLDDSDEVEMVAKIENLTGLHVRSEYVSGLSVTSIKVLEGRKFDPDDLVRLAHNSGLLMDYFLSRALDAKGEKFKVRTQDVGRMLVTGYDVDARGAIELRATPSSDGSKPGEAKLEIVGGEVTVEGTVDGVRRIGRLKPKPGSYVLYDEKNRLATLANANWEANMDWFTTDHLLFGTKKMRNVKVASQYEARFVPDGSSEAEK